MKLKIYSFRNLIKYLFKGFSQFFRFAPFRGSGNKILKNIGENQVFLLNVNKKYVINCLQKN